MKNFFQFAFAALFLIQLTSCDECKDVTCTNGSCEDGTCICPTGFSGTSCEVEDKCITNNVECLNDGVCEDGECDCEPFYRGDDCGTYCVNGRYLPSTATCDCYPGWDSDGCTNEMRLGWIGEYSVAATGCFQGNINSEITSMDHPDPDSLTIDVSYVGITNLTTAGDTKAYGMIIEDNKLMIPAQNVKDGNGTTFNVASEEPVSMSNGSFELVIIRKFQGNPTTCTLNFTAK